MGLNVCVACSSGAILTNMKRTKRGLSSDPHCKWCPTEIKDLNYIFRNCTKVLPVWPILPNFDSSERSHGTDFMTWSVSHLSADTLDKYRAWQYFFAVSNWWVWRWRNEGVFSLFTAWSKGQGWHYSTICEGRGLCALEPWDCGWRPGLITNPNDQ